MSIALNVPDEDSTSFERDVAPQSVSSYGQPAHHSITFAPPPHVFSSVYTNDDRVGEDYSDYSDVGPTSVPSLTSQPYKSAPLYQPMPAHDVSESDELNYSISSDRNISSSVSASAIAEVAPSQPAPTILEGNSSYYSRSVSVSSSSGSSDYEIGS